MSGVNKVILIGHLGKDPEARQLEGGVSVVSFPMATSETFNKDGRKVEQTEWHNIVMWRGLADVAAKFLQNGVHRRQTAYPIIRGQGGHKKIYHRGGCRELYPFGPENRFRRRKRTASFQIER